MSENQASERTAAGSPNLVPCRICQASIYRKAEACPHCGADYPGLSEQERQRANSPKPRKARENDYAKGYFKGRFIYESLPLIVFILVILYFVFQFE